MVSYTVVSLSVHEPGKESICWKKGSEEGKLSKLKSSKPTSQLTAWFQLNRRDVEARQYTYLEIPKHYSWEQTAKNWKKRILQRKTISRVHTVSPKFAERFAIRMLAINVRGATSFEDLRTVDGIVYDTFTQAAKVIISYQVLNRSCVATRLCDKF